MFIVTSDWLEPHRANWARMAALERSISSRKKNSASLKMMQKTNDLLRTTVNPEMLKFQLFH